MADEDEYFEKSKRIRELAALQGGELSDHLSKLHGSLENVAPNILPHIYTAASNAIGFLNNKLPSGGNGMLQDEPTDPSPAEKDKWLDLHKTIDDPLSIVEKAGEGTLTKDHLDAVKAVYPDLHQELSGKIQEALGKLKAKEHLLPYQARMQISQLIGQPLDSTMTPQSMLAIIASQSQNKSQTLQQAQPGPKKASGPELTQINKVNSLQQTPDQARAANKKA